MDHAASQQCYTVSDLSKLRHRLIHLQGGDNQNAACCGGRAREGDNSGTGSSSDFTEMPPHLLMPPAGGMDKRTKIRSSNETAEARKLRLTGGYRSKTLLDDTAVEPLPPRLRRPGEPKRVRLLPPPKPRGKSAPMPAKDAKYHEKLDRYLNHLPFFGRCRYDRGAIVKRVTRLKPLRGIFHYGRCYIEKDWRNKFDPRMDPDTLVTLLKLDDRKRKRCRSNGPVYRIVELFMEKVLGWGISREMMDQGSGTRASSIALLWLGPSLAKKMLNELCVVKDPSKIFEFRKAPPVEKDFFIINRLPVDVFFSDKETFYCMLNDYILSPSLTCKTSEVSRSGDGATETCQELEARKMVTRRVCPHQNLSLSLKPCLVPNCPNFNKLVCKHLYAFIPETILISSHSSMLTFVERFQNVEDLKGCIFITKPAYLCNGRAINFLLEREQFEYFYHMMDGRATSRHGVVLQRYIECPRLFDQQKFTIRFFLLIIVLPKRRVLAFIHYGLAIFCFLPYHHVYRQEFAPEEEALEGKIPNLNIPIASRTIGRVVNQKFSRHAHLSNYYDPNVRAKIKENLRTGKAEMMKEDEDNVFYLEDILPSGCMNSTSIYIQMLFAAQCILDYMQPVIQDYPGTFQTVSIDSLVDARNKLWILEAGTKIFSGLLTVGPRQRCIMSNIIQESLGVTIECFYKSHMGLPLYWNYKSACEDYDAFYFAQDFNFFYETDVSKQTDFYQKRCVVQQEKLLEQRYIEVDISRDLARARRLQNEKHKKKMIKERKQYIALVKQKHEEES